MGTSKPSLFVVSSDEALKIAEVVRTGLGDATDADTWKVRDLWTPGRMTLETLLQQASSRDFAVVVFHADDILEFRGDKGYTPRDNVLFEAGLFMSHLGPRRTFILLPREPKVKVLSDLSGITKVYYDKPEETRGIIGALEKPLGQIREAIKQLGPRQPCFASLCGPAGFHQALAQASEILEGVRNRGEKLTVLNLALDMEHTWGVIRDHVFTQTWPEPVVWRSLMLDHTSSAATDGLGDAVTGKKAEDQEQEIITGCESLGTALADRKITFECRAYGRLPIVHGLLLNEEDLYFSLCAYHERGVSGVDYQHIQASPSSPLQDPVLAAKYIGAFKGWFNRLWSESRWVWPRPRSRPKAHS